MSGPQDTDLKHTGSQDEEDTTTAKCLMHEMLTQRITKLTEQFDEQSASHTNILDAIKGLRNVDGTAVGQGKDRQKPVIAEDPSPSCSGAPTQQSTMVVSDKSLHSENNGYDKAAESKQSKRTKCSYTKKRTCSSRSKSQESSKQKKQSRKRVRSSPSSSSNSNSVSSTSSSETNKTTSESSSSSYSKRCQVDHDIEEAESLLNVRSTDSRKGMDRNGSPVDSAGRNRLSSSRSIGSTNSSRKDLSKHDSQDPSEPVTLKKDVGLVSGVALIVGTMIGSGIFISARGVTEGSGSVGLSLIIWTLCGVISLIGALSYAELGTFVAKSGAEYSYLLHGIGPLGRLGGIPAFLFAWINMVLLRPASVAIIILTFAAYTTEPFFDICAAPLIMQKCLAIFAILLLMLGNCFSVRLATGVQNVLTVCKVLALLIIIIGGFVNLGKVVVTGINIFSVKLASRVQIVFTAAKILALFIIIVGGLVKIAEGNTQHLNTGFKDTQSQVGKIAIGIYNGMWAYDGWNNLNYVTEELINPYRNLPLAIYIALPLVTVLYVLVNISYFSVMSVHELLESPAVAVTWASRAIPGAAWIIPVAVALSTFGAVNGSLFSSGRLTYVAAREGHMVELLSMIHIKRHTPLPSLVFTSIIAIFMVIPGNISSLIDFFSFAVWLFYGMTMVALLIMRYTRREEVRPYKVPIVLPIFILLVAIFLVIAPIVDNPRIEFLYAFLFIVAGLFFYFPFVHFKFVLPGTTAVTTFCQLLMECSLAHSEEEIKS